MRRIITLTAFALAAFVVTPALAAPGGGDRFQSRGDRGPGWGQSHQTPSYEADRFRPDRTRGPAVRPGPAPVINRAQRIQADRIKAQYNRERAGLVQSLRVAERRLDRLTRARFVNRAQVRVARLRVANLKSQLQRLDANYQRSLARVLTPRQVRYFLNLG